jgi:hypothetical protein
MPFKTLLTTKSWIYWAAIIIIIAAALMILFISWLFLRPSRPFTADQPYKVTTPVVAQGTKVTYQARFCTDKEQRFTSERQLLNTDNGVLWDIPDLIIYLPRGCETQTFVADTPSEAPAGKYKVIERINLRLNSIQTEAYQYESEPFNITQRGIIR